MKYRKSFVTNSSSSSYICDICGENVSGWDMSLGEAEMIECVNGHTMCEHHLDQETLDRLIYNKDFEEEDEDYEEDCRYEFPEKYCPFCSFKEILDRDLILYLQKYHNLDTEKILQEIKSQFSSYQKFKQAITKNP